MKLGAFSISLNVKDIKASKEFYKKLGFVVTRGDISEKWLILKNEDCIIGIFQGMFPKNILTFNPGWNNKAEKLPEFTDIRDLQRQLKDKGLVPTREADEKTTGPDCFTLEDPDGHTIFIDQHI